MKWPKKQQPNLFMNKVPYLSPTIPNFHDHHMNLMICILLFSNLYAFLYDIPD